MTFSRILPHRGLKRKAQRINDSLWPWCCLSTGQPGLRLRKRQPDSLTLWNQPRRGVRQQADTREKSRRNMIASGQGLLLSGKFLGTWREMCLNGSVSHIQEFVEQKGDHAMAKQGSWQRAFMEGPRRAGEHRADWVITTLVIPDPHSQEPVPFLLLLGGTLIVQFFSVGRFWVSEGLKNDWQRGLQGTGSTLIRPDYPK